jgi:exopolysaccharide production protein ExoQ
MALLFFLPEIAAFLIFFMMATQSVPFSPLLAAAEIVLLGLLLVLRAQVALQTALKWWPLLLMPILAPISTLWSDAPMTTLRYGAQFLATAFLGVLLARLMTPRRFLIVFMGSMFVFCLACLLYGRQGVSAEGMVLIGLTGSKNQMGYAAQLLVLSGLAVLLLREAASWVRWIAALSLPLGIGILVGVNSATALLMGVAGAVVLIALWFAERLQPGGRLVGLIGTIIIITPLLLLAPEFSAAWDNFLFNTLNKDPTLTGRTVLWEYADEFIARRPFLGYGYQAFWMGESADTLALKRMFFVTDGRTFHFHHQYRQVAMDTGLIGLVAFAGALIAVLLSGLRQLLLRPTIPTSFFYLVFVLMAVRGFTDVIIGPMNVHMVLFCAACAYAFWTPETDHATSPNFNWGRLRPARIPESG